MRQRQEVQEVLPPVRIFPALPTESAVRKLPYRPARSAAPQIHGPHDAYVDLIADALQPLLEFGSLIAAVGRQLQKEWIQAEQRAHQHHAAVAVLDVGGMPDGAQQQTLRVDQAL